MKERRSPLETITLLCTRIHVVGASVENGDARGNGKGVRVIP